MNKKLLLKSLKKYAKGQASLKANNCYDIVIENLLCQIEMEEEHTEDTQPLDYKALIKQVDTESKFKGGSRNKRKSQTRL